ncbi:MAG: hypothetical protein ACXVD2_00595 [Actinomycetota bacterium]
MRRAIVIAACAVAVVAASAPAARAATPGRVLVIGLPTEEARFVLSERPSAVGLGVFPDSRASSAFLAEVGVAAPRGLPGTPSPLGGAPGKLRATLETAGISLGVTVTSSAVGSPIVPLADAFGSARTPLNETLAQQVAVVVVGLADDADALIRATPLDTTIIVVGADARTPVLVGVLGRAGLLDRGVAERPGVVTPYDLAATIEHAAGIANPVGGRALQVKPAADPRGELDALRARFERDRGFGLGLTGVTAGLAIFGATFGVLFAALGRRAVAAALARAAAMVPAGYVGALFVPSSRWEVRSTVLVAAFAVGLLARTRSSLRFCGAVVLLTSLAIGVLTVVASRNPGGEPALSLWGDPLNSWRFFGIRNHLSAFLAGGFVLGSALLSLPLWLMLIGAIVAGVVVGAPTLGAPFIGVLTLAFGAAILLLGVATRRVRFWHVPIAIVVASGAAAGALIADAGRQISHGGRAVASIKHGGWHAAWEFFRVRARLNYDEISSLGPKGFIAFVIVAIALAWLFVWAMRSTTLPVVLRAGAAGVAAAGIAALVVEDSGFLTSGIYLLYPALGFATGYADLRRGRLDGSGSAPPDEPPRDAGDDDHGDGDARQRE